tara:strand:+ start:186188 stop:186529 length:342 start_codon:yes stop_codon:yes gene_type:complete
MRFFIFAVACLVATTAWAGQIPYHPKATLKVGQTVILKGVRTKCDGKRAPGFFSLRSKFPKVKIGVFKDGGKGTVNSKSCNKEVPARAIVFKATKKGKASFQLYGDKFVVTVK